MKPLPLLDYGPEKDTFLEEVKAGLSAKPKTLPCKYLYDETGSRLFEAICELDDYYPTRTELGILRQYTDEIVDRLGSSCLLVEYGSGSSLKTRILLDHLEEPSGYVPIDIARAQLTESAGRLARAYPDLMIQPICADYTQDLRLPTLHRTVAHAVVFFPGSTIGNFMPAASRLFLRRVARLCGEGGGLLIGIDLKKDLSILEAAYNDREGITAAFNKNLLVRLRKELRVEVNPDDFHHSARYEEVEGRIEMHLVSLRDQQWRVGEQQVFLRRGESIITEYSYKYDIEEFGALAAEAGLAVKAVWTDSRAFFALLYLEVEPRVQ